MYYNREGVGRVDDRVVAKVKMEPSHDPHSYNRNALKPRPGRYEKAPRKTDSTSKLSKVKDARYFRLAGVQTQGLAANSFNRNSLKPPREVLRYEGPPTKSSKAMTDKAFDEYFRAPVSEYGNPDIPIEIINFLRAIVQNGQHPDIVNLRDMLNKIDHGEFSNFTEHQKRVWEKIYQEYMDRYGNIPPQPAQPAPQGMPYYPPPPQGAPQGAPQGMPYYPGPAPAPAPAPPLPVQPAPPLPVQPAPPLPVTPARGLKKKMK